MDTSSATVGKVVENRRIADLPLNGRNALALVMLTPGVKSQAGPTNSGFVDRGTALSAVSINGGPSSLNGFIIDGGNNNSAYLADINANPTVDAVQEFKVQSNVMSAEFGFTAGGVVNIVTKSGTNTPHGIALLLRAQRRVRRAQRLRRHQGPVPLQPVRRHHRRSR